MNTENQGRKAASYESSAKISFIGFIGTMIVIAIMIIDHFLK